MRLSYRFRPINPESQPESGKTIAFDTRYEVRTQVDSSAPADKFPEMCGSATLAIDVSSTSMNVASVTVTAITQGLIDSSAALSLASIRCLISRSVLTLSTSTWYYVQRSTTFLYSAPDVVFSKTFLLPDGFS